MTLKLGRHAFADDATLMMAIVNRTPDSFYDKGATWAEDKAFERVAAGGRPRAPRSSTSAASRPRPASRSTRPRRRRGSSTSWRGCARRTPTLVISVDTWRASVGEAVCAAGADLLNDAWGGADPELVDVAAEYGAAIVCTHTGGVTPRTRPLPDRVRRRGAPPRSPTPSRTPSGRWPPGSTRESIVIDPAHDFGKNTFHSLELTRRLGEMVATGWPVLVSLSNKDFVGETLDLPVGERLIGTLAATAVCALAGARIYRVHEVVETRQVVDMVNTIAGRRPPRARDPGAPVSEQRPRGTSGLVASEGRASRATEGPGRDRRVETTAGKAGTQP